MTEFIRSIIEEKGDGKLEDLDEVIDYLKSLALDEDTTVEDFRDSFSGFFENIDINDTQVKETLESIRNTKAAKVQQDLETNLAASDTKNEIEESQITHDGEEPLPNPPQILKKEIIVDHHVRLAPNSAKVSGNSSTLISCSNWTCECCTFENELHSFPRCEVCGGLAKCPPPQVQQLINKTKPTSEEIEELNKELATNSLNSVLASDVHRRRGREQEEESRKLLHILLDAEVSDGEHCRKMLERHSVTHQNLKDFSFVELIGFGLSASNAKLVFDYVEGLNEKPELELHVESGLVGEDTFDASPSEINELMFLIPDRIINRSQVEYVYFVLSKKSIEIASRYLVETLVEVRDPGRLAANVRKIIDDAAKWWENRTKPKVDEKEACKIVKDNLMKRYDETPDDSKVNHRPSVSYGDKGGGSKKKGGAIRYLDGNKVNMKSVKDKFVIEDTTVDWDGGSRGKVKTKGKRGPGFVSS